MGREARLHSVEAPPRAPAALTTTLGALAAAAPVLERMLTARVPAAVAYRFAKLARALNPEVAHFHKEREALIRELGAERDVSEAERATGASSIFEVKRENIPTFNERLAEVQAVEVSLDVPPLTIEDLEHVEVSGADLLALGPLVSLDVG